MEGLELYSLRAFLPCGTSTDSEGGKVGEPRHIHQVVGGGAQPPADDLLSHRRGVA